MLERVGSQTRESLHSAQCRLEHIDEHIVISEHGAHLEDYPTPREAVLLNSVTGNRELWVENDHYAGYVIVIDEVGFEFVREI